MQPVTTSYLEMREAGELKSKCCNDSKFEIRECVPAQWQINRALYFSVGEAWSWTDKRGWSDEQWREYVESDSLRTFVACYGGSPAGYYELHGIEGCGDRDRLPWIDAGILRTWMGRGLAHQCLGGSMAIKRHSRMGSYVLVGSSSVIA